MVVRRASLPKKRPDRHRRKTVTFRIPADLMEALRESARRNRRTLWREAGLAIETYLMKSRRSPSLLPFDTLNHEVVER
jgi:hypothetical protein